MALQSNPPPDWDPVDYQQVNKDVEALYRAGEGKLGTDEVRAIVPSLDHNMLLSQILSNR